MRDVVRPDGTVVRDGVRRNGGPLDPEPSTDTAGKGDRAALGEDRQTGAERTDAFTR
jgi:hypothetical protein